MRPQAPTTQLKKKISPCNQTTRLKSLHKRIPTAMVESAPRKQACPHRKAMPRPTRKRCPQNEFPVNPGEGSIVIYVAPISNSRAIVWTIIPKGKLLGPMMLVAGFAFGPVICLPDKASDNWRPESAKRFSARVVWPGFRKPDKTKCGIFENR